MERELIDIGELESPKYDYNWQKYKVTVLVKSGWCAKNITAFFFVGFCLCSFMGCTTWHDYSKGLYRCDEEEHTVVKYKYNRCWDKVDNET
jgi:hypothetical protein